MLAHLIMGTSVALLTAFGAALFGSGLATVGVGYVLGGLVTIALSTSAQALRQWSAPPQPATQAAG